MKTPYIVLTLLISVHVMAQDQPAYEQKTYRDESGNLYWNLSLPVYVQISASADMKNSQALNNVKKEDMKKFANPLHFDGHGIHYIRHLDYESPIPEKEIAYEVNVDGIAPKTLLTLQGAPAFLNTKLYFGKNLEGTITAKDEMSGIETIIQSINAVSFTSYSSPLSFSKEGDFSVKFYSVDRVGNAGKVETKEFVVDLTAPTSSHSARIDLLNEKILSPRSKIKLVSKDELSGVKSIMFTIDDGKEMTYLQEFGIVELHDGDHTVKYKAIDNVKNTEEIKQFNFYYDAIAPEVTSSFNGTFIIKEARSYMASSATFSLAATDNKAGVKEIYYSINGGEPQLYSSVVNLPKQGAYNIKFKSVDNVNNQTGWKTNDELKNVFVDETAPAISHAFKGPKYFTRDTVFVTQESLVQLFATDLESGVLKIEYQSDAKAMQTYTAPFPEAVEGFHMINFSGTDQVKNTRSSSFFYTVDNSGPELFYHMSLAKIGTQHNEQKGIETPVFASGTSLYLAATDKLVGTKAIYYKIDNTPEILYTNPIKLTQKGMHSIKIRAIDNLDNLTDQPVFEVVVQ